jgi:hypothetical protein
MYDKPGLMCGEIGEVGELEEVEECRVEVMCVGRETVGRAVEALKG